MLNCEVDNGASLQSDIITFQWSKDDNIINNEKQAIQINKINSVTSELMIDKLNPDLHSGVYSCRATYNNISSNSASESTRVTIESIYFNCVFVHVLNVLFVVVSNFTQSVVESFEASQNINETHYSSAVVLPGLDLFNLPIRYGYAI